ncbi:glycosyltransferase [Fundidesulfovibrio agrisoli]|uniref:glycosyltransferase n=1 Tax=Fundidesulfovibrio agrisoli TaxID=2922717 RepID=UPI001FAB81E9|nr:glycosyltransferase [Fundidesulfovibrio agrisoli]
MSGTNRTKANRTDRELASLDAEGACNYYLNFINNFQNSNEMAAAFYNRVLADPAARGAEFPQSLAGHAHKWCSCLTPLDEGVLAAQASLGVRQAQIALEICRATNSDPQSLEELRSANYRLQADEIRDIAVKLLSQGPMNVLLADLLLNLDFCQGHHPDGWLGGFKCPKAIQPLWNVRLFQHYAGLGATEQAMRFWDEAYVDREDPVTLNLAAELFRRAGDTGRCLGLYERSLALDPLQYPVELRLRELREPFRPSHRLVSEKQVCIYLYCYNKARSLAETLESLAACDIGAAKIKILLNGCTDDSAASAARATELFPNNEVEVITLPVNIGAPAARNWLISQPATWESDYVAFLDDDVELQPDWLAHFLTVAEADPSVANVGCKVVFPGEHRMIQYLYRYVSVANSQMVRVSIPTPGVVFDVGLYDVVRPTRVVMGCQHMMRVSALKEVPWFDIRYSPSQVDDTDHDLQFCLKGYSVAYCGTVTCVHKHSSGVSMRSGLDYDRQGNVNGNDVKFFYKYLGRLAEMSRLDSLSLNR